MPKSKKSVKPNQTLSAHIESEEENADLYHQLLEIETLYDENKKKLTQQIQEAEKLIQSYEQRKKEHHKKSTQAEKTYNDEVAKKEKTQAKLRNQIQELESQAASLSLQLKQSVCLLEQNYPALVKTLTIEHTALLRDNKDHKSQVTKLKEELGKATPQRQSSKAYVEKIELLQKELEAQRHKNAKLKAEKLALDPLLESLRESANKTLRFNESLSNFNEFSEFLTKLVPSPLLTLGTRVCLTNEPMSNLVLAQNPCSIASEEQSSSVSSKLDPLAKHRRHQSS